MGIKIKISKTKSVTVVPQGKSHRGLTCNNDRIMFDL